MSRTTLILVTDIDTDCDDAGALALLHALIKAGECELAGVVCSVPGVPECAGAVYAINSWYGRFQIPIGAVQVPDFETVPAWQAYRAIRASFLGGEGGTSPYNADVAALAPMPSAPEESTALYRRLLASVPDNSVTICAIGTLTAVAQLLSSEGDTHSPLNRAELVRAKVRELVCMAVVAYPDGRDEFNWIMDTPSAAFVATHWPTPLTISPHGHHVFTGARFVAAAPPGRPVREAYRRYLRAENKNRPSWDQIAALYAVRGLSGPFARSGDFALTVDVETRWHKWHEQSKLMNAGPRRLVLPTVPDKRLAQTIEDVMTASLAGRSA